MSLASQVSALAGAIRDKLNTMTPRLLPSGGTGGQVLSKINGTNYNTQWTTLSGGGGPAVIGSALVDFAVPDTKKTVSFPDASALTTHVVMVAFDSTEDLPNDIYAEQIEVNPVIFTGDVLIDGTVTISVISASGLPVVGKYALKYTLI